MEHGFFHPDRGYWQTISTPSDEMIATHPDGTVEIPLQPSEFHTWNGSDWVPPTQAKLDAVASMQARTRRDYLLASMVDPIVSNPLRWAAMSAEQQQGWKYYRLYLLDIPQQAGFPTDVIWPTSPNEVTA